MKATTQVQGRFVSTCGLKKIVCSSESRYELIIVDSAGHPVSHVTEWYRLRKQPSNDGTRRTYLNFLLPFFGHLLKRDAPWNREPEYIRTQIKEFLREEVACFVARDDEPIFLTRRGTPYTRSSWYYHWNKRLAAVPPDEYTDTLGPVLFTPHDTHWICVRLSYKGTYS